MPPQARSPKEVAMKQSLRILLHQIVDYAGLFPPASLTMDQATANYAAYREQPEAWMLGRFVVPVARLADFEDAAGPLLGQGPGWRLSALLGADTAADIATLDAFNRRHTGRATIDVVELRAASVYEIVAAGRAIGMDLTAYVEIPPDADPRPLIAQIEAAGLRAKIRTGGVTAEAFPDAETVARFIAACVENEVAFKATAGLHHPIRAAYRLTYAPDSPSAPMYGYLNVFVAAALLSDGGSLEDAVAVLRETDPAAFQFDESGISVRGRCLPNKLLAHTREGTAIAFGSCSFREPVDDLRLLEAF
jgi:hypothetical protein